MNTLQVLENSAFSKNVHWHGEVNDMFITLGSSHDTGIGIIDIQHRLIMDYINRLHDAVSAKDMGKVADLLDDLIEYTVTHFAFEESLMETQGYPATLAHSELHEMFIKRLRGYQKDWSAGRDISQALLNDLKSWWLAHIESEDRDYARQVRAKLGTGGIAKVLVNFFDR